MRALIQRVTQAGVTVEGGGPRRAIGPGLAVLLGVGQGDSEAQARKLAEKIVTLRVFSPEGKFDKSLLDVGGQALVVSQFTLYGSAKGGRRPDFTAAAAPAAARPLYERFCELLRRSGATVVTGDFGASMQVDLVNDGPVTLLLDTDSL